MFTSCLRPFIFLCSYNTHWGQTKDGQELALFTAGGRRKFLAGVWNLRESKALVLTQGAATSVAVLCAWSQDRGGQKAGRPSWPNLELSAWEDCFPLRLPPAVSHLLLQVSVVRLPSQGIPEVKIHRQPRLESINNILTITHGVKFNTKTTGNLSPKDWMKMKRSHDPQIEWDYGWRKEDMKTKRPCVPDNSLHNSGAKGGGGGLVAKLRPTLVSPWTVARQAPLSTGFSMEWVAISFSTGSFPPRNWTWVSCIARVKGT